MVLKRVYPPYGEKIRRILLDFHDSAAITLSEGIAGEVYADDEINPQTLLANILDFRFLYGDAGKIENLEELLFISGDETTLVCAGESALQSDIICVTHFTRYRLDTPLEFDIKKLESIVSLLENLPDFCLREVKKDEFLQFDNLTFGHDLKGICKDYDDFKANSLGYVITHKGEIVSGCCAYSYYSGGYEIQVETDSAFRGLRLASICSAAFILKCVKRNKKPHWDAANEISCRLAQRLGFVAKGRYTAYNLKLKREE